MPLVNAGIVAVSRDCFLKSLSINRRRRIIEECRNKNVPIIECETVVENERDVLKALEELDAKDINTLVIYLGNFGPEGPLSMLAERFDGPVMLVGAAEDAGDKLMDDRGDAYCGMLNASYNMGLRWQRPYIPETPVCIPSEMPELIGGFLPTARIILGLKSLKIFSFGPRPQDFLACNAPVKPLYDLGVEIMETANSICTISSKMPRTIRKSMILSMTWQRNSAKAILIRTCSENWRSMNGRS